MTRIHLDAPSTEVASGGSGTGGANAKYHKDLTSGGGGLALKGERRKISG